MYIKVIWPPLKSTNVYTSTTSGFNAGNLIEGFFKKQNGKMTFIKSKNNWLFVSCWCPVVISLTFFEHASY